MGYIGSRIPEEEFKLGFDMTVSRGPDMSRLEKLNNGFLGFHRLAIMGLTDKGMQPFSYKNNKLVCNGEIYGFRPIKDDLIKRGYTFEATQTARFYCRSMSFTALICLKCWMRNLRL